MDTARESEETMTTLRHALLAAALIGGVALSAGSAAAQERCFLRDQAIENLKDRYGEDVVGRGISNDGKVMFELFTSTNGSWTLLKTHADGKTCMVGTGEAWTAVETVKAKGPAV